MPYTTELREDGHVIYTCITDPLTGEELSDSIVELTTYYEQSQHKLHQIVDVSRLKSVPTGIMGVRRSSPAFQHANRGHLLLVGANGFVRTIAETIFKIANFKTIVFFSSEAEAWTYVHRLIAEEYESQREAI